MYKAWIVLIGLLLTPSSFAEGRPCFERMRTLYARDVRPVAKSTLAIRALLPRARSHYMKNIEGVAFQDIQLDRSYAYINAGKVIGYKLDLNAGGDEDQVSYYADRSGRLVYARWSNQSPIQYWICE